MLSLMKDFLLYSLTDGNKLKDVHEKVFKIIDF